MKERFCVRNRYFTHAKDMGPEDELYSSEEEDDDTWMNKSAKNILTPAMQERCSNRHEFRIKIMVYYKQCQLECSYEKATAYLSDYLIGHDDDTLQIKNI